MAAKVHYENPGMARTLEKQLRRWEIARGQHPNIECGKTGRCSCFLAMSNEVGAGGDEIAALLGARLGWPVFDKEILQDMARNDEVRARLYKSMDERDLGWFEETFRAVLQQEFHRNDYFHRLTETVLCLARQGPAIFLGRAADLILPAGQGLRVKVIASRQRRVENFVRRTSLTPEEASVRIERIEQERRDFIRRHFHADADNPTRFDMLINVERFSTQEAADLIGSALMMRTRA